MTDLDKPLTPKQRLDCEHEITQLNLRLQELSAGLHRQRSGLAARQREEVRARTPNTPGPSELYGDEEFAEMYFGEVVPVEGPKEREGTTVEKAEESKEGDKVEEEDVGMEQFPMSATLSGPYVDNFSVPWR